MGDLQPQIYDGQSQAPPPFCTRIEPDESLLPQQAHYSITTISKHPQFSQTHGDEQTQHNILEPCDNY